MRNERIALAPSATTEHYEVAGIHDSTSLGYGERVESGGTQSPARRDWLAGFSPRKTAISLVIRSLDNWAFVFL